MNLQNILICNCILLCFFLFVNANDIVAEPISMNIKLREEWNAREPKSKRSLRLDPAPFVVVHHSATQSCFTEEKCKKLVKSFQTFHMDTRKWNDIAYNFVIGQDGNIYEGRGWGIAGSHSTDYNDASIGICIAGNFVKNMPNDIALDALRKIINFGVITGEISENYKLIGHRQASATECPGQTLYDALKNWPHWEPHPINPR